MLYEKHGTTNIFHKLSPMLFKLITQKSSKSVPRNTNNQSIIVKNYVTWKTPTFHISHWKTFHNIGKHVISLAAFPGSEDI
jgi:hypothetical protein